MDLQKCRLQKCRNFMECRNCIFVSYLDVIFITVNSLFSCLHLGFYGIMPKTTASAESANGTSITRTSLNKNINRLSVFSLYLVVVCTTVELVEYHFPEGSRPIAWGCSSAYDLGLADNLNTAHPAASRRWNHPCLWWGPSARQQRYRMLFHVCFITDVVVDCDVCRLCVDIVKLPLKPLQFVQPRSSVSHFRQLSIGLWARTS